MVIFIRSVFVVLFVTLWYPVEGYAYVDPNTGGYIFQLLFPILSILAAIYLFFKNQVKRIFASLIGLFRKRD